MPVADEDVDKCPDCGFPQQSWRSREHVSTCPRAVVKDRDDEGLRRLIRACLRELDQDRKTIRTVMARLRLRDDEHNYETQAGKDSHVLRRLLPQEDDA